MSESTRANPYFGGRPTEPDVRELMVAFDGKGPGDEIELTAVAAVIAEEVGSRRFETVLRAFRERLLRDRKFVVERIRGMGTIRIVTEDEKTDVGLRGTRVGLRKIRKSANIVAIAKPENMKDQRARDSHFHASRILGVLTTHVKQAAREIAEIIVPPPPQQLPRWRPPGDKVG